MKENCFSVRVIEDDKEISSDLLHLRKIIHSNCFIVILLATLFLCLNSNNCFSQIPQNPFTPSSSWSETHSTYCQQNCPVPSITEADEIIFDTIHFPVSPEGVFTSGGAVTTDFYGNSGVYCAWVVNGKFISKAVCSPDTTVLISKSIASIAWGSTPSNRGMIDKDNLVYSMSDFRLFIVKDSLNGDPYSPIVIDTVVDLSSYQNNDNLRGIKLLYSGQIVLTTTTGTIIVMDRISREVLYHIGLNEVIQNNMAVDEQNNLYLNTEASLYKFNWTGDSLRLIWSVAIGASGTTPTLIGNTSLPDSEQLVVVIDKSIPMNLILVWKDSVPAGWTAFPGWPLRVAAVQPITFNVQNPAQQIDPTGNSVVVENNSILLARWTGLAPGPGVYKPGLEKWTWNPATKSLSQDWVNTTTSLPNATQCLSTSTGYFYSIGEKFIGSSKYWTFEVLDWATGQSKVQKILGPHNNDALNIYASGIQIGPYGDIITMSRQMVFRFRKAEEIITATEPSENENNITIFPNPFRQVTKIAFDQTYHSIDLAVYDIEGRLIRQIKYLDSDKVLINGDQLSCGLYLLKITLDDKMIQTRKILLTD
jgi:hypothetical protein